MSCNTNTDRISRETCFIFKIEGENLGKKLFFFTLLNFLGFPLNLVSLTVFISESNMAEMHINLINYYLQILTKIIFKLNFKMIFINFIHNMFLFLYSFSWNNQRGLGKVLYSGSTCKRYIFFMIKMSKMLF